MRKLITALTLLILLTSCSHFASCPPYPAMPDKVKDILKPYIQDSAVNGWANDQLRLKKKLAVCRDE